MDLSFLLRQKETSLSLRQKAENLLAQSDDAARFVQGKLANGENRLNRTGRDGDFRQFRFYRDGDRPQDIDWKRSARSDDVLIKERDASRQNPLNLYIDNNAGMHFRASASVQTKYEIASIIGVAFALRARLHHDPVRFYGHKINVQDLPELLIDKKISPSVEWSEKTITVIISDFTGTIQHLDLFLSGLASQTVLFLQILDPAELSLPYQGRKLFENGSVSTTINNVDAIRENYQVNLRAHLADLKQYAQKKNWHYDLLQTDQDLAPFFNKALAWLEAGQ